MNIYSILIGIFSGALISLFGVFVINRRLALAADAFSHIALPGVAIGILLGINYMIGAFAALLIGTFLIQAIQIKTKLYTEILIGLIFSLSLAVGLLLLSEEDLESALLGDITKIGFNDFVLGVLFSVILLWMLIAYFRRFTFITFSETLAQVSGVNVNKVNFMLLICLALAVAIGIKVVGTLLVGSLLIIPAATSQIIAKNLKSSLIFSSIFGVLAVILGVLLSYSLSFPPGPVVILFEGLFFAVASVIKKG